MNTIESVKVSKGEKTKARLLRQARLLFAKKGYDATGVDEIAGAIAATSGVFYTYYKSKKELLIAVMADQIMTAKRTLFPAHMDEDPAEGLRRVLNLYLSPQHRDQTASSCPLTVLSQELLKLNLQRPTGLSDYAEELQDILASKLGQIEPGKEKLASVILAQCLGAIMLARIDGDREKSQLILSNSRRTLEELIFPKDAAF